jgi:hypothetical protein
VIRNAVIHMNNEQPMIADLFEAPSAGDVGLRCTNLRDLNRKRPKFVDDTASIFFFPYIHIRFVEIPLASLSGIDAGSALATLGTDGYGPGGRSDDSFEAEPDIEIDEDFLRRIRDA